MSEQTAPPDVVPMSVLRDYLGLSPRMCALMLRMWSLDVVVIEQARSQGRALSSTERVLLDEIRRTAALYRKDLDDVARRPAADLHDVPAGGRMISTEEAAARLGCKPGQVQRLVRAKVLTAHSKRGARGAHRIFESSVTALLDERNEHDQTDR